MKKRLPLGIAAILTLGLAAVALTAPGDGPSAFDARVDYLIPRCNASAFEDIEIPAQYAGLLVELIATEGAVISEGDPFGKIDDMEAQSQKAIAEHNYDSAEMQAESEIPIIYARKAAEMAKAAYDVGVESNKIRPRTTPVLEIKRRHLDWQRAEAQVDQEGLNTDLAQFDMLARQVDAVLAGKAIERRQLKAPFTGEVVQVFRHQNEWLQQGEPILRFMRRDKMRVRGHVDASQLNREDVAGCRVTVVYIRARDEQVEFEGFVLYSSPIIDSINNQFEVVAVIDNIPSGDHWILPERARVSMTIHAN